MNLLRAKLMKKTVGLMLVLIAFAYVAEAFAADIEKPVREPGAKEKSSALYARFVDWYHDNIGKNEPSGTWFGKQLSQKYEKNKSEGVVMYHGIALAGNQGGLEG